jgi:hypothetical protein
MDQGEAEKPRAEAAPARAGAKTKLPASAHVLCGWPLVLVAIGGAIGGGLGGVAYAINVGIYKSRLPRPAKVILNILTGLAAFGIWFAIAMAIQLARR